MANSSFSIKVDTSQLEAAIDDHVQRQIPYAASVALNATANAIKTAEQREIGRVFDRPTPYTLNSLRVVRATKSNLAAFVTFKDGSGSGRSAETYLAPEVEGGNRNVKGIELFLRASGLLPSDRYLVPGDAAALDANGNMSRLQYTDIVRQLRGGQSGPQPSGTRQRSTGGSRNPTRDVRYFVGRPGSGRLPLGVWARYRFAAGYAVRPVLVFARRPTYSERFPFFDVGATTAQSVFPTQMQAALASAMRTARR